MSFLTNFIEVSLKFWIDALRSNFYFSIINEKCAIHKTFTFFLDLYEY